MLPCYTFASLIDGGWLAVRGVADDGVFVKKWILLVCMLKEGISRSKNVIGWNNELLN